MNKLMPKTIEVKTDKVFLDFKNHFELDGNKKILFSGKYGTGKSYFLNTFFSEEKIKEKYNVITISPVNYSVSQNEDIFELIKADVIRNFFMDGTLTFVNGDISFDKLTVVREYIKHSVKHPYKIGKQLIYGLAKLGSFGTGAEKGVDGVYDIISDFEKYEEKLNKEYKPKEIILDEYSEEIQNKIGSYLEFNFISSLIKEILIEVKTKYSKDNILVIEDFDRLDPAHIFRILNIFSAHTNGEDNKFGFDKVIIVCDLQNIESLYKHLYGDKIDFDGYIDKFYSFSPYYFNNTKALYFFLKAHFKLPIDENAINAFVHLLQTLDQDAKIRLRKFNKSASQNLNDNKAIISYNCEDIISQFVYNPAFIIDKNVKNLEIFSSDIPLILVVKFLKNLYGGYDQLLMVLTSHQDRIGRMDHETSINYLKLLIVPIQMCSEPSDYSKLFFKSTNSFEFPEFQMGHSGKIKLFTKWRNNDKYSSGSYYEKMKLDYYGDNSYLMDFKTVLETLKKFIKTGLDRDWIN
jgi:hypothetical protein